MQQLIPRLKLTAGRRPEKSSPERRIADNRRPNQAPVAPLPAGHRLPGGQLSDKFEIIECIGKGATSLVFRVRHRMLEKEMAVKVLIGAQRTDLQCRTRFFREASVLAALSHPGIVRVHTYGDDESFAYVAMDLISGESLQQVMERRRLSHGEIVRLGALVASALAAVHQQGIVHRDVKPANIMLTGPADRPQPVLVDFGSSVSLTTSGAGAQRLTHADSIIGTPVYMSPEQFTESQVDARSDIYSLGCLLYELIAGDLPFATTTLYATAIAHAKERPPALPADTPRWLARLIMAMLEKNPDQRPQTMDIVAQALTEGRWNTRRQPAIHETLGFRTSGKLWATSALCTLAAVVMLAIALPLSIHQDSMNLYRVATVDYQSHFKVTESDKARMISQFRRAMEMNSCDHRLNSYRELECKLICAQLTDAGDSKWKQLAGAYTFMLENDLNSEAAISWFAEQVRLCVEAKPALAVEGTDLLQGLDSFSNRANPPNLATRRAIVHCWALRGRSDVSARLLKIYGRTCAGSQRQLWKTLRDYLIQWQSTHIQ